jgi:nuclease-like protein/UvrD-like helicase family protein/AAA domain-containing protein
VARMVPEEFGSGQRNRAEELVFDLIRDQTPDAWVGLHHVGLPRHPKKPIAEIDFVVITEPGIFCLEVKGGAVRRVNGIWYVGNGRALKESPYQQVGGAQAALRHAVPAVKPYLLGYGCVFPDCKFEVEEEEVLREATYDVSSAEKGFEAYLRSLGNYWKGRHPHASPLGNNDISRVLHALRGDFEMTESILPSVRAATKGLIAHTEEQKRAVEGLRERKRVVVRGGAGTGKTLLAINEAARLADDGHKTLFTCFNKAIGAHLAEAVDKPNLTVAHLDSLVSGLIDKGGTAGSIPPDADADEVFGLYRPLAAAEAIEKLGETSLFDALVVDEGQDLLTSPRVDVLEALLRNGLAGGTWRVFWDPLQALFMPDGEADLDLITASGADPVHYSLALNCRNTIEIASRTEVLSGVEFEEVSLVDGLEPLDEVWKDAKDEVKRLRSALEGWRDSGLPPGSITVLSPRTFDASVASQLKDGSFPIKDRSGEPPRPDAGAIAFSTIHAFKGLESEAVLLTDVDDIESKRMEGLLYVGASRARTVLGVLRKDSTIDVFTDRLLERARRSTVPKPSPAVDFL